jgi:hypothetical protein
MAETTSKSSQITVNDFQPTILTTRRVVWIVAILGSLVLSVLLVQTNGNLFVVTALVVSLLVIGATLYRLDWGFYIFLFFVFLFDQFNPPAFQSFTSQVGYFLNLNAISWLPTFDQGVVTPMELQLAFLLFVWIFTGAIQGSLHVVRIPLKWPALLFGATLCIGIAYGQSRGGDFIVALWGTRAFFYLLLMLFFLPQVIRTKEQVHTLLWVCIAGISIKGFQGAIRYASNGFSFGYWPNIVETYTNHEDPVFMITLFLLMIAFAVFKTGGGQRRTLLWLLFPLLIGFQSAQRRATYASFMASLVAFIIILPKPEMRRVIKRTTYFVAIFAVYLAVFWNVNSRLGTIAQSFKATVTEDTGVRGEKDKESNMYREAENYNLGFTYRTVPLTGVGFGSPYLTPVRMWGAQGMSLGKYIPHNQILWIPVEIGFLGTFVFWFFLNCYVFYAVRIFVRLNDPYLKAVATICVVQMVNQLVVSYVDMQLTYYRNMTYLGLLMGLILALDRIDVQLRPVPQPVAAKS